MSLGLCFQALPAVATDSFPPAAREAIARVQREAASRPDSVEAVSALARTLHAWELWEAAHQAYARLQQLDAQAFEWRYLDGVVLQRLARHADAARVLQEALARSPGHLPARVRRAEALFEAGDVAGSVGLFTALVKEPAAEPVARLGLGRAAAAAGRHEEAVTHLERAVALFPEFGAAHYALARSYRTLGRLDAARQSLARHEQHGAAWPAVEDALLARVSALRDDPRALVQRGTRLADAGDLAGGIAAHEAALAGDPSFPDVHANLIALYGRAGQWGKAEERYRSAVALGVNLGGVHYDYGVVLALQERWDEAAAAYRRALDVNPLHAQARNNLGQVLERQRQLAEAETQYRRAVEAQPGFRLARFNLGRMLIARGQPDEAATELSRLTEPRDAEAPRYLFALSVAHVRAGRRDEGIRWATEARALARQFGQHELAAAIDRDLAALR